MELFGDHEDTLEQMVASIQEHGQTVPIMVRNSEKEKGRYEVIFGRRRLAAIRYIRAQPRPHETEEDSNLKIKANIQTRAYGQPEDEFSTQVLVAQALENAARKDLPCMRARALQTDLFQRSSEEAGSQHDEHVGHQSLQPV